MMKKLTIENKKETGADLTVKTTGKQQIIIPAGTTKTLKVDNIDTVTVEIDELNGSPTYQITKSNNVSAKLTLYRVGGNGDITLG